MGSTLLDICVLMKRAFSIMKIVIQNCVKLIHIESDSVGSGFHQVGIAANYVAMESICNKLSGMPANYNASRK